jgi:benzoate membrane transport protein
MPSPERIGVPSAAAIAAGLLSAFVGFASTFAVVLKGLLAVGATQAQAASGLMALSLAMGLCAVIVSLKTRLPISIAWSTPGAALLATTPPADGGFAAAVGAFLVCGALIVATGALKPLGRAIAAIPAPIANAMLAGILLSLCLAPFRAIAQFPAIGLGIVAVWAVVARLNRLLAVPAAVLVVLAAILLAPAAPIGATASLWPIPVLVAPTLDWAALLGIGLPLYLVTMASQNIPGIAVLKANGYEPEPGPLFSITGLFSLLAAPFGGHAVNLAAITAALCAAPEADPDPARRFWAAAVAGLLYIALGLTAGAATAFIAASPPVLIEAVAGLALLGAFASATQNALADAGRRDAAVVTFLATASGATFLGIGAAFWGLVAGGVMLALGRMAWR